MNRYLEKIALNLEGLKGLGNDLMEGLTFHGMGGSRRRLGEISEATKNHMASIHSNEIGNPHYAGSKWEGLDKDHLAALHGARDQERQVMKHRLKNVGKAYGTVGGAGMAYGALKNKNPQEKTASLSSVARETVKGLKLEGIHSGYKGVRTHTEAAGKALQSIRDYIEENREAKRLHGVGPEHIIEKYFKNSAIGRTFKDPKLQSHVENYVNGVTHAEESKETLQKGLKRSGKTYGTLAGVGAGTGVGYRLIKNRKNVK